MVENKRKSRGENKHQRGKQFNKKRKYSKPERKKRNGPGLPNVLRKELEVLNRSNRLSDTDDEEIHSDDANDVYEYEEAFPEEDSKKNRRFDPVENFEYELPEDFEDENVASDEGDDDEDDKEEEDNGTHARMLEGITGLSSDAFEGKRKKNELIISEAYPESEYNPTRDILDGNGKISIHDLLEPLRESGAKLKERLRELEKTSDKIHAPIPKPDQERVERRAANEHMKKDLTKWGHQIKMNREAPTIYFDEDVNFELSTVGRIAAEFEPRTDFEKNIASLVNDSEVVEAHRKDGARLLELNKISVEDVMEHQNRLAKMRSLLFRHEVKAKRIKKIKSKTYHRLQKKDRLKAIGAAAETDPEAAKEMAMKQEYKRAQERMTLKHKNSSKWAKRILIRGLDRQGEGTKAAIAEQLQEHARLTRKMNSMRESSSSDSSDEDDIDEISADSDPEGATKLLNKAKQKTLEVLEGDDDLPKSGLLSLPFMVRGLKKRKEIADEEAKLALQDYDSSLKQADKTSEAENKNAGVSSGRRIFGAVKTQVQAADDTNTMKTDNFYGNSDSENDIGPKEVVEDDHGIRNFSQHDVSIDPVVFREESEIRHDPVFKSFEDTVKDPGPKTAYEVSIFASNSWKKMKNSNGRTKDVGDANTSKIEEHVLHDQNLKEEDDDSDTDSGGQMVDGILSSGPKPTYELLSDADRIRRVFADDDVVEDFEKEKEEVLNEENPEPEKPLLLPGWGQWTDIQKKKGLPSWMLEEHETAKKKREEALKKRKDAHLNHVIISEKYDKKAEKLHTKTLPYPYTSKDVFEQSIRMPIGPEYNPATAIQALIRPEVVKKSGIIIKPIKFEDVNPHERSEDRTRSIPKKRKGKGNPKGSRKMIKA